MLSLKTQNVFDQPAAGPMAEEKPRAVRFRIEELEARVAPAYPSVDTTNTRIGGFFVVNTDGANDPRSLTI